MATNMIEKIQASLEYPALRKIDPNIQDTKNKYEQSRVEILAQAAIPAVLAGIYRLSRSIEGSAEIINMQTTSDGSLLKKIFKDQEELAVQKVSEYGEATGSDVRNHMEIIAAEAIRVIRKDVGEPLTPANVKTYMNDQRHNILLYLPAAMNIGDLLQDETLDDRTNKMEGPISNLMHKIEDKMSGSGE